MKQLIILLLLFLPALVIPQSQKDKINGLHLLLLNAANDTIRMDAYGQLGYYYKGINNDSSRLYLMRSLSLAQKLKLKLYEAGILHHQGNLLMWSNYPQALKILLQALKITENPESEKNVWNLPTGKTPHTERLNRLGYTHFNMGQLYGNTGNTEKQISSIIKAKNLAESVQDSGLNMVSNLILGGVYLDKLKKFDSAHYFVQRALSLSQFKENEKDIGWILNAIGRIHLEKENFDLSKDAFTKGLQIMQEQNNLIGVGEICLSLSNFHKILNNPDSSLQYAYKALEAYNTFKAPTGIAKAYSSLSSAYNELNRTDRAFAYLKLATSLRDSLNNEERENLLAYQNVGFDEQIRLRNLEDEKIQTRAKVRTYSLLAGLFVFMTVAVLLYINNRNRRKTNALLKKQKEEIVEQKESVEQTLVELKSTQAQLIQSEKMASLGELTAGIAHEIQNPLNFVNNFSDVNSELIDELKNELQSGNNNEALLIANDIKENEQKINHHGKRADAIVKGMLQHSRKSSDKKEPTDINALVDEYLRLTYHGLRAKDKSFNASIQTSYDETIGLINVIPQDLGRVLLNLFSNAFYAVNHKKKAQALPGKNFEPIVSVTTKKIENNITIVVNDNGIGISEKILDKIYQPFFTTKPTGEGTGLGLSISYDIITKGHGGQLKVKTKVGEFAEFIITLPMN